MKRRTKQAAAIPAALVLSLSLAACGDDADSDNGSTGTSGEQLSGTINIDGSSTVAPLSEAASQPSASTTPTSASRSAPPAPAVASRSSARARPTSPTPPGRSRRRRIAMCEENGIEYEEIGVANDGLVVAINPDNDCVDCLTLDEISSIQTATPR